MVNSELIEQILALSPDDRGCVAALIASLGEDLPPQLNPEEQKEMLRRAEDAEKHREKMLTWEQVKENLAAQRAGRSA